MISGSSALHCYLCNCTSCNRVVINRSMNKFDSYLKGRQPVSKITVLELRNLLTMLSENAQTVYFRYRLIGRMWHPNFLKVHEVTEKGVFLKDESQNKTILISDLNWIVQFELDGSLHAFAPNFHYDVVPD